MWLKKINIARYGPLEERVLELDPGINVFYGPNESGKTLLLDAVLRLLLDDAAVSFKGIERIEEAPEGFILLETPAGEVKIGRGQRLKDFFPFSSREFRNIFVIRDSDLYLEKEGEFYSSLTARLVGLRTGMMERLIGVIRQIGRLTPAFKLADQQPEKVATARQEALKLAEEIGEYIEKHGELEEIEAQIVNLVAAREKLQREYRRLENARRRKDLDELQRRLALYGEAEKKVKELKAFTRDGLSELKTLAGQVEADAGRIEKMDEEVKRSWEKAGLCREKARSLEVVLNQQKQLLARIDGALRLWEGVKNYTPRQQFLLGSLKLVRPLTLIAAALCGGLSLFPLAGAVLPPYFWYFLSSWAFFLVVLILAWFFCLHGLKTLEGREEELLDWGREMGFSAGDLGQLKAAINLFRQKVERREGLYEKHRNEGEKWENRAKEREKDCQEIRERLLVNLKRQKEILAGAGVENAAAYAEKLAGKEKAQETLLREGEVLRDRLGGDPGLWDSALAALAREVDEGSGSEYDAARLEEVKKKLKEKGELLDSLQQRLEGHREKLREFEKRAAKLSVPPFAGSDPTSISLSGLESLKRLREELLALVGEIEENAEISRLAIGILREMQADEQQQVSRLFAEGRAAELLAFITEGRYRAVRYDPQEDTIVVEKSDGKTLKPDQLSQGAFDQLYLCLRIALAEKLLGSGGFFLLDDAFLTSDPERLVRQFKVLERIASKKWQVLYFTAKGEVADLARDKGLPLVTFAHIPI